MKTRALHAAALAALLVGATAVPALADDHLANAVGAAGADARGFANPVAANPSGTSGASAQPLTVPGQGNPAAGEDTTTPAVDLSLVSVRSGDHGPPAGG